MYEYNERYIPLIIRVATSHMGEMPICDHSYCFVCVHHSYIAIASCSYPAYMADQHKHALDVISM